MKYSSVVSVDTRKEVAMEMFARKEVAMEMLSYTPYQRIQNIEKVDYSLPLSHGTEFTPAGGISLYTKLISIVMQCTKTFECLVNTENHSVNINMPLDHQQRCKHGKTDIQI